MEKNRWIFSAILFIIVANLFLGEHRLFGGIFLLLWLLRIFLLGDTKQSVQTLLLMSLFSLIVLIHISQNQTMLSGEEEQFILSLNRNSFKIDGDYLSFSGINKSKGNKNEKLLIQYYMKSIKEKEYWQNQPVPTNVLLRGELVEANSNSNFNQFNYKNYLNRQKINWLLKAKQIQIISTKQIEPTILQKIASIRLKILQYLDEKFHEKVASYLKILFIGESSALNENTKQSYRSLGLIHLFSISGFHISYLATVIERILLRLGVTKERTNFLLVVILPLYGLIAGLSISIYRAVTQKIVKVLSIVLSQEIDNLDAWSLALISALALNPYSIFELSFQLSYSLSFLFILMGKREWIQELGLFRQSLFFSTLASLISLPILTYHFYEISWITILSNLLFIPFFSYLLFPSLSILLLLSFFSSKSAFFIHLNRVLAAFLIQLESVLLGLTDQYNFSLVTGRLPYLVLLVLFLATLSTLKKVEKKRLPSLSLLFIILLSIMWNRWSPLGYIVILDVGQGDSILIKEAKTRKITLIDTGGKVQWQEKEDWQKKEKEFSIGKDIVASSLKSFGISKIDRLYISHAHADHMGEIYSISQEIRIKEIASSKETLKDQSIQTQVQEIEGLSLLEISSNQRLNYPTSDTMLLHPNKDYSDKNNQSLVLYVKMGDDRWMFTGDLEAEGEQDLIKSFPSLKVDYLKIGHHGSSTSSTAEFLDCIQVKIAFISVAKKNRYNHPDPEVINRLEEKDIEFYSTAEDGAIKINYFKVPFTNEWFKKIEKVNQN